MKKDLGIKYVCYNCAAKFYDLNKPEAVCPICDANQARRPKKKERKSFRSMETLEKTEKESGKEDLGGGDSDLLVEEEDEVQKIAEGKSLKVEEDEEEVD